MIIVKLLGGVGNQMFQYAAGLALSKKHHTEIALDINYLLDKSKRYFRHTNRDYALDMFNITGRLATNDEISHFTIPRVGNKYLYHLKRRLFRESNVYRDSNLGKPEDLLCLPSDSYLDGYWQDVKYLDTVTDDLRREFTFSNLLPSACQIIDQKIQETESVCVIFRRGDYVGHPTLDIIGLEYYTQAVSKIADKVSAPYYFVFSDDIPWCKNNFKLDTHDFEYVDQELTGPNASHYLQMITHGKHFIIPNSTFAWWGAWLGSYRDKIVVAPKAWFRGQDIEVNAITPRAWLVL